MSTRYRTSATATADGPASVPDGLTVQVTSPLRHADTPETTNPEQLLALAWAGCLVATAKVLTDAEPRVRVEVSLVDAEGRPGFEFRPTAFVSAKGLTLEETELLAASAHDRCPVSRLMPTSQVRAELFA